MYSQAHEQVDHRQLKHKGELNPALQEYRINHLAQELQASQQSPSSLNCPSTPALGPSQFLELLANAMSSGTSGAANNKGSAKASKDGRSDMKQFTAPHEQASHAGSGGMPAAVHIKQEGGLPGQSSKSMQGQGSKDLLTSPAPSVTMPHSSPGAGGGQQSGGVAKLKTLERPKSDGGSSTSGVPDTPLTHFRTGGKPAITLSGQRTNSGGGSSSSNSHPFLASTMANSAAAKPEDQSIGQSVSAQKTGAHIRTKGPVTRSSGRASSPSTCGDALPKVSGSPSEKNANLTEKAHGLNTEEARKLRQAQQKLQKEQWIKKYGQGTKRTLEMQGGAGSTGDGSRQNPPSNLDVGAEAIGNDVLISDGELELIR